MHRIVLCLQRQSAFSPDTLNDRVVRLRRDLESPHAHRGETIQHLVQHAAIDASAARRGQHAVENADRGAVGVDPVAREAESSPSRSTSHAAEPSSDADVARGPFGVAVEDLVAREQRIRVVVADVVHEDSRAMRSSNAASLRRRSRSAIAPIAAAMRVARRDPCRRRRCVSATIGANPCRAARRRCRWRSPERAGSRRRGARARSRCDQRVAHRMLDSARNTRSPKRARSRAAKIEASRRPRRVIDSAARAR